VEVTRLLETNRTALTIKDWVLVVQTWINFDLTVVWRDIVRRLSVKVFDICRARHSRFSRCFGRASHEDIRVSRYFSYVSP
jgi:hypothetical protein